MNSKAFKIGDRVTAEFGSFWDKGLGYIVAGPFKDYEGRGTGWQVKWDKFPKDNRVFHQDHLTRVNPFLDLVEEIDQDLETW